MEKSYKLRIYLNEKQKELIAKTFGCTRFVYNYFLDYRIKEYKENKRLVSCNETSKLLTQLKKETDWLREPDKDALQKSLKDLDVAYQNFFKLHTGFPKFKSKKDNHKSYRTSQTNNNIRIENSNIKLPKLGYVRFRDKTIPQGRILNATISQDPDGKYYCSVCCTDIIIEPFVKTGAVVGIDLGIVDFAITSDNIKFENKNFYERSEAKLAKLQKELSRKSIGGSNRSKARIKVARLHKKIHNQRQDYINKLTTYLVNTYDIICIENLSVSSMKETDSSVRNKRVSDVSWYEFRRQLEYKCKWYGKKLIVVDRYYPSSQICHICGHRDGKKDVSIRVWKCPVCNSVLDRDLNAAINILNEGLKQI